MKKTAKSKVKKSAPKRSSASAQPAEELPNLLAIIGKLVERLESLERKSDAILGRLSQLPSDIRNTIQSAQQRAGTPAVQGQPHRPQSGSQGRPNSSYEQPFSRPLQVSQPSRSEPMRQPQASFEGRRERTLYPAVCADCRKNCEVPIKPAEGRPVYCKACFALRKSVTAHHTPDRRSAVAYLASKSGQNPNAALPQRPAQAVEAQRTAMAAAPVSSGRDKAAQRERTKPSKKRK